MSAGARVLALLTLPGITPRLAEEAALQLGLATVMELRGKRYVVMPRMDTLSERDSLRLCAAIKKRLHLDAADDLDPDDRCRVQRLARIARQIPQHSAQVRGRRRRRPVAHGWRGSSKPR